MRRQKFLVDPGRVMKTVQVRRSYQLDQITIAGLVLRQKGEMKRRIAPRMQSRFFRILARKILRNFALAYTEN